jgi:pimeloyl-ACP methyl ester carboxylesterase
VVNAVFLTLSDGRVLAWDVHGPASGIPLFYFHGAPSARIEAGFFGLPEIADRLGIRLIVPDRPGLGLSDYQRGRTILDWPRDVIALADHLGLDRFSVLGYSGGGPYALACAQVIPERLDQVVLVSSTGPHEVPGATDRINPNSLQFMRMCAERPVPARLMVRSMGMVARWFPERMAAQAVSSLPEPDARVMGDPTHGMAFANMVSEAARRNGRGPQLDTALMVRPWGLNLDTIAVPVRVWHGTEDCNAPLPMGEYLASTIPEVDATFVTGEGHLSLMFNHRADILQEIVDPPCR